MSIEIVSTKRLTGKRLVVEIVDRIKENPNNFKYVARIFADYTQNKKTYLQEVFTQIDKRLSTPKLKLEPDTLELLSNCLKGLYKLDKESFATARGDLLESAVYHLGPVSAGMQRKTIYLEPTLKESDIIIGEMDVKCDVVFFQSESEPFEFIECKANIANFVPAKLPFDQASKPHRNKVTYLSNVYHYLKDYYTAPKIYFACYNLNYGDQLRNLQENWGYEYMDFVNAEEIVNGK